MPDAHANLFVNETDFAAKVEQSPIPVLVDFYADWCAPCRMIAPSIAELATEFEGRARVLKVNVEENPALAARFNIRSIPMLMIFKGGQPVQQIMGAVPKESLAQALEEHLAGAA